MFIIPKQGKFSQTNKSDLFGNIDYTKSINFNDEGYLKLSSRTVSLNDSITDTDFNRPVSFGRSTLGSFYLATTENPYILSLGNGACYLAGDKTGGGAFKATLDTTTYGKWWRNAWHVTNNTKLYADFNDTGVSLTTGKKHPIEGFEKAGTLMIGNGNTVKQLNSSYAVGSYAQLTLSTDYEVVSLAYNNNFLGIGTRLASTIDGQNKEAMFFTWDGSASSANSAYGVGANSIICVAPYKSSFVVLNGVGKLLYFNGGGFEELATFPISKDINWGAFTDVLGYGDMIKVDGELIYINIQSSIIDGNLNSTYENLVGGVWCYDPAVGLYHRYSPSISKAQILVSRNEDINTTTNTFTKYDTTSLPTSPTIPDTGNPIKVISTSVSPLKNGTIYYIIKVSPTEFKIATSKENALALIPVDITSTSDSYFMTLDVKDYGQHKTSSAGGVAKFDYKAYPYDDILFGGTYYREDSTGTKSCFNISVYGFKNIGYFVTTRLNSADIEDNYIKGIIKYKPLKADDSIIIKYKNKDYEGIPEYATCTATSSTVITTTSYIPKSYAFTGELECEVISGAGAGQMVKVSSITESSGTYTITLAGELEGVSANNALFVKLDNWKILENIDSGDTENYKEFAIAKNSKWTKIKGVLSGSDITIEELQVINDIQIPSK